MKIEIRLKALLKEHGLDRFGVITRIANELHINRHTVTKLYQNRLSNPSLDVLGKLCEWLINNGVPREILPEKLLGSQPEGLWNAASSLDGVIFFYGEYLQIDTPNRVRQWVSLHDADAANGIIRHLSTLPNEGGSARNFRTEYVPFSTGSNIAEIADSQFRDDTRKAKRIFESFSKEELRRSCRILIGSQRVNTLLELFVSDLFSCTPFVTPEKPAVPFYQVYRADDRKVPSCFGGQEGPPGCPPGAKPGILYWESDKTRTSGKWVSLPWAKDKEDAGIVITVWDPGTGALDLAFFGFSARATSELGRLLVDQPYDFWPPAVLTSQNKRVEVFVCRFDFSVVSHAGRRRKDEKEVEVVRLSQTGNLGRFVG